jgi:hypothetical protein
MKYVKRPIPIEAVQWLGRYGDPPQVKPPGPGREHLLPRDGQLNSGIITTNHGDLVIREGDWVLGPGPVGEYWPVAKEVFEQTYVPLDEAAGGGKRTK